MSFKVRVLFTQWKQGELVSGFRKHATRYLVPFAFKEELDMAGYGVFSFQVMG